MRSISGTSDFGKPGVVGRFRTAVPVCIDTLGETWAGYVAEGPDAGRSVFITILSHPPDSLPARPILNGCREAVRIRHPNLLAFLDVAPTEEFVGLVSEYMQGEPLSTLLSAASAQRVPLPPGVALTIMRDAIETLSRLRGAHPESFSHGGLCPETIFVASFGETILRNSGLQSAALKMVGFRKHPVSLPYRAPEYLLDPRDNEETADVFSAGVMLWEMLAGQPLFGGVDHLRLGRLQSLPDDQVQAMQDRILNLPIPSLGSVHLPGGMGAIHRPGGAIHPEVVRLVDWCLQREPADRPQTLQVLGRALSSLPRGVVAKSTEVAGTVQRLAGATFTRREELLAEATGITAASSATRPTSPAQQGQGGEEEPTAPRLHRDNFDPFDVKTVPGGQRRGPLDRRAQTEEHFYAEEAGPDSRQEEPHPPAVIAIGDRARDAHTSGGWLFAAIALLAAGGAASYTLLLPGHATSTSQGDPEPKHEVSKHELPETSLPAEGNPSEPPAKTSGEDETSAKAPGTSTPGVAPPPTKKFTGAPPSVPRRTAVPKKSSAPAEPYRPKGI